MISSQAKTATELLKEYALIVEGKKEDLSPKEENEFHEKLDSLVHDTFGHSKKEKSKVSEAGGGQTSVFTEQIIAKLEEIDNGLARVLLMVDPDQGRLSKMMGQDGLLEHNLLGQQMVSLFNSIQRCQQDFYDLQNDITDAVQPE